MKHLVFAAVCFATLSACGTEPEQDPLVPSTFPVEGRVGSCSIVCDYTKEPTVLRVETTPGDLMSCEECRDSLVQHFLYNQCTKPTSTFDFNTEDCQ